MMKNTRSTLVLAASLLAALPVVLPLGSAFAQPPVRPAAGAKTKGAAKGAKVKGMTKRILTNLEAKMGKPLTTEQKTRLIAAYKVRQTAMEAADAKLATEATGITGLTAADWDAVVKPGRKKAAGAMGAAQ